MFMRNESNILRDMAELKRVENRRRHLRVSVRNNVFYLGRYIRTCNFSDLPIEQLDQICTLVEEAAAITRMNPAPMREMPHVGPPPKKVGLFDYPGKPSFGSFHRI
jgi:hypothetical protein